MSALKSKELLYEKNIFLIYKIHGAVFFVFKYILGDLYDNFQSGTV